MNTDDCQGNQFYPIYIQEGDTCSSDVQCQSMSCVGGKCANNFGEVAKFISSGANQCRWCALTGRDWNPALPGCQAKTSALSTTFLKCEEMSMETIDPSMVEVLTVGSKFP